MPLNILFLKNSIWGYYRHFTTSFPWRPFYIRRILPARVLHQRFFTYHFLNACFCSCAVEVSVDFSVFSSNSGVISQISHIVLLGNLFLFEVVSRILFVRTANHPFCLSHLSLFHRDLLQCNWIISISFIPELFLEFSIRLFC